MFTCDGITWDVPCKIEREAEVRASDISGLLLNRTYFNDVIGTYLQYTVSLAIPLDGLGQYTALYEILTAPVDGHQFVLPYNDDTIEITGRVEVVSDEWRKHADNGNYWRHTSFTVLANHPSKWMSLDGVLTMGGTPMPSGVSPAIGDFYEYTSSGWVSRNYPDLDEVYF